MDDFLKKVDGILSLVREKRKDEEKEMEELRNFFDILCLKAQEAGVTFVIKAGEDAFKITSQREISLAQAKKSPSEKNWMWGDPSIPAEKAKDLWLPNRNGRLYSILSSALKNEADVEIE